MILVTWLLMMKENKLKLIQLKLMEHLDCKLSTIRFPKIYEETKYLVKTNCKWLNELSIS